MDLLFYHLELRCFVVIELEMRDFKPEYSGMMNCYIAAIDDQNRKEYDQPTIGHPMPNPAAGDLGVCSE
jgi:hypothetical protein